MKARTRIISLVLIGLLTLAFAALTHAIESGEFAALFAAGQYEEVAAMCNAHQVDIAASPDSAEILSICAQAFAATGGGPATPIPQAAPDPGAAIPDAPAVPEPDVFTSPPTPEPPKTGMPGRGFPSSAPTTAPTSSSAPSSRPALTQYTPTITVETFVTPLSAKEYDKVKSLCDQHQSEIQSHPDRDQILKACGQSKLGAYENKRIITDLTGAMGDMEKSLKARYDNVASFDLGMARIRTIDTVPKEAEKLDQEREAILEMWDAIVMRHALENFSPAVSDQIIVWTIGNPGDQTKPGYVDMLIERVIKNEGNQARQRWMAARIRMLADRFVDIDPNKGENATRQQNLDVLKGWMNELLEKSYFDNNIMVGMLVYKADRHEEMYDQSDGSEQEFHKAIYFYDEALKRAQSNKAMSAIHMKMAFVCSRYRSADKTRLIEFYKKGFLHARNGLRLMMSVNKRTTERGKITYRYEEENAEITGQLQKSYGNNLTGYIYNLYLVKEYKSVVGLKGVTLDVGFDWENKNDVLLLFAECAKELASQSIKDEVNYFKYKEMCLSAGSRAFKFVLKRYGGKPPASYDQDFCKAFNAYWTYLDSFGQLIQAKSLENQYGHVCPSGTPAPAAAAAQ